MKRVPVALWLVLLAATASAQSSGPPALVLVDELEPGVFDSEALRVQLERELGVPVVLAAAAASSHLVIGAASASAVRVAFVRDDGSAVERTLDVSSTGVHANETVAIVAANLMRDEAAGLLASLQAAGVALPAIAPPRPAAQPVPAPPPDPPSGCAPNTLRRVDLGIDVLPYVGMSSRDGTRVERRFSFNLFGGATGAVRGFELAGFVNLADHSVCGLQIGGIANLVNGPVQGVQLGMIQWANGRVDGVQFGLIAGTLGTLKGAQYGLLQLAGDDISGAQLGLANLGGGSLTGAQLGLANVSAGHVLGAQLGLLSVNGGLLVGAQLGLANVTAASVRGAQLGLLNVSGRYVRGLQAGLVNVSGGKVHGAMIGLLNVAEDADVPVGLVNVLWNGRTHLDLWGTDMGLFMLGIEHGSRFIHTIYGIGAGAREGHAVYAPAYGIGARLFERPRFFVDLDAIAYGLIVHDERQDEIEINGVAQLRVPIGVRLGSQIALFVSPALNVSVAESADILSDPALYASTRLTNGGAKAVVRMWPGFTLGARFF